MSDIVNTAPKFVTLLAGEARPESASVAILLGTADKQKFGLEFDAGVAPAVVAALAGLTGKAAAALPPDQRPTGQALQTTGMALGVNEQGQPGILLMLEGGAELTLALSPSDLPAMRDMIDQAIEASELKLKH